MGRKKSGKYAANKFKTTTRGIRDFLDEVNAAGLSETALTWSYETALIRTTVAFEKLMLECLIVALNKDTGPFSDDTGVRFPKHLDQKVCEYLVTGGGYFDFRGRDGLLKDMKKFTGPQHYLQVAVRDEKRRYALELLLTLRNYAAHQSPQSKEKVRESIFCFKEGVKSVNGSAQLKAKFAKAKAPMSAGVWLKRQGRMTYILDRLDALADEIHQGAPY
ncbi:hypothetical protein [Streptomyces sp. NPDC004267]|uniref:hypothetical protein n=1 Tax=Streptomyces sp. NPDC004267 TaxID=3364694 RepID=UPI003682F79D